VRARGDLPSTAGFIVDGHRVGVSPQPPGLYVVATPIGNLGDITLRALTVLGAADLIACEDTRVTAVLLRHYGIAVPLLAYHDHNAARQRPRLLAALAEGKSVALVSDAGTPLVSDPGFRLVQEARAAGAAVIPIPGPSAVLAALVAAGLPTDAFLFAGFLPVKAGARATRLVSLAAVPATLVFFESAQRLGSSLAAMAEAFGGERRAAVTRELTKMFETVVAGTLAELAAKFADQPPKGEIVVVVEPPAVAAASDADADAVLAALLADRTVGEAAAEAASLTGLSRRELYRRALVMTGKATRGGGGDGNVGDGGDGKP
jgi:16S rRNA (cytidine1402-2'-O)-methyltransferase